MHQSYLWAPFQGFRRWQDVIKPKCPPYQSPMFATTAPSPFCERKRACMACSNCRRRKIKCVNDDSARDPCERCSKRGFNCEYVAVSGHDNSTRRTRTPDEFSKPHRTQSRVAEAALHIPTAPRRTLDSYYLLQDPSHHLPPVVQAHEYASPRLQSYLSLNDTLHYDPGDCTNHPSPLQDHPGFNTTPLFSCGTFVSLVDYGHGKLTPGPVDKWHPGYSRMCNICSPAPCYCYYGESTRADFDT
ncbi:hypothetical protein DFH09DRAFT_256206 [Mycena vulgaris]|nr:hypothetical protein DFH09DRAFT_256206 [Mycena vulgaris]